MATVEIEIPASSVYVGVVRLAVSSLARGAGLDEDRVDDLKIAVSEACSNAVLSGESQSAAIKVGWTEEPGRVVVEVSDPVSAFDPGAPSDEDPSLDRLALSLELVRSLVDECEITAVPGGGMLTRLVLTRD